MPDSHLTADLGHRKERHHGKTGPHLVAVLVGHLNGDVAMYRDKLELGIGHDPVGVKRLTWLVQPNALIGPPQGKVRPVSITCRCVSVHVCMCRGGEKVKIIKFGEKVLHENTYICC